MDRKPFRILAIAGSLRQGSYNRRLLRAAEALAPDGVEVRFFDIGQLPFFNRHLKRHPDRHPRVQRRCARGTRQCDRLGVATDRPQCPAQQTGGRDGSGSAALAAEAAAAQGKFWEMHDYIFHHQHTLEDTDLTRFAGAVGLQMQQFTRALAVLYWGVPCAALEMADPSLVVAASGPGLHWEPSHVHLSSFLDDMSYFHAFVSGGAIYGDWTRLSRAFADFIGMACPTIPMKPISYF